MEQRITLKVCTTCRQAKPADADHFLRHPRVPSGITSPCRECHKARMRVVNRREYANRREYLLVREYRKIDARSGTICDLTEEWLKENVTSKPCFYCGTEDDPRGAERLDNAIGHIKTNVVPCCQTCNKVRNNLFTVDEMKRLGAVIAAIRARRKRAV